MPLSGSSATRTARRSPPRESGVVGSVFHFSSQMGILIITCTDCFILNDYSQFNLMASTLSELI